MTRKDVLPEKHSLEKKAAVIKRSEYSPLGKELKEQTDIAKKQYQKLESDFESNVKKKKKKSWKIEIKNKRSCPKSNLVYNNYFSFLQMSQN